MSDTKRAKSNLYRQGKMMRDAEYNRKLSELIEEIWMPEIESMILNTDESWLFDTAKSDKKYSWLM